MTLRLAAALVAVLACPSTPFPAACASARAAVALAAPDTAAATLAPAPAPSPFPTLPLHPVAPPHSHLRAYALMAAGAGLVGVSFAWQDHANRVYDEYLAATEPDRIRILYDRTAHYDRLSSSALIGGETLIAGGLWLRFLHHPALERLRLAAAPGRCALALRF